MNHGLQATPACPCRPGAGLLSWHARRPSPASAQHSAQHTPEALHVGRQRWRALGSRGHFLVHPAGHLCVNESAGQGHCRAESQRGGHVLVLVAAAAAAGGSVHQTAGHARHGQRGILLCLGLQLAARTQAPQLGERRSDACSARGRCTSAPMPQAGPLCKPAAHLRTAPPTCVLLQLIWRRPYEVLSVAQRAQLAAPVLLCAAEQHLGEVAQLQWVQSMSMEGLKVNTAAAGCAVECCNTGMRARAWCVEAPGVVGGGRPKSFPSSLPGATRRSASRPPYRLQVAGSPALPTLARRRPQSCLRMHASPWATAPPLAAKPTCSLLPAGSSSSLSSRS